jgi:hypothetical protein
MKMPIDFAMKVSGADYNAKAFCHSLDALQRFFRRTSGSGRKRYAAAELSKITLPKRFLF